MNNKLIISLVITAFFSGASIVSQAATDKPRCKPGQVAKMDARTGKWVCKSLMIKGQTSSTRPSSTPPSSTPPPMKPTKATTKKPARARPDLTIVSVTKVAGSDNKFQVKVQNIGTGTATGAVLSGEDTTGQGGGGTMPIPTLKPTFFSAMIFQVPSAHIDHGDRIKFFADAYKKVSESNENNNVKYFTVP